jgi:ATP-dependent helicase/nuclease subunit A
MNAPRLPKDHAARDRAATDFATNLVVSAGAGTGKTTLLVERIVTAIGSGVAPLSAVAAITFTDKAAGELRHRLAKGLRQLRDAPQVVAERTATRPEDVALRAALAEVSLDRAAVMTIHGFCAELLRAHPLESGLPPGFTVDRGLAGRRLASEEWTRFIEDELGPSGRRAELWQRVLQTFNLAKLEEIARALAGGSISDAALDGNPETFELGAVIGGDATRLAHEIRQTVDATSGLTGAPREWLDEAERALRALAADGATAARRAIEGSRRLSGTMPGVRTAEVALPQSRALEVLAARALPYLRGLRQLDEKAEADLFEAVVPFARRLRARQTRSGIVDFDGLLVRARDLLRDDRAVRDALKRRFRMILVDEFQDTDPIQYEIVFFLSERDGDHASDAYDTRLAPGRLFIVGDAKQSIYRFRGADYAAYQRAVRHVVEQGGATVSLTSNFRSTPAVLRPINALFAESEASLWRASAYLPPYEPIEAEREHDGATAVQVWTTSVGDGALAGERRRAEGLALAAEIAAIAGPGGAWRYDDVLVLFRGFSGLAPYLRALREADVPFVVSGGRAFFERPEIVQAMAVLRAVADPDDRVALLAYRRSPAGGVPDTELAAAASGGIAAAPALAAADSRLEALRAEAVSLPVDAAVRHVLDASGLVALSGLGFEAAQRVANLEKLALAASELSRDGRRSLIETLDALEEGFEADEEGDSPLADADRDAVRVMTIHKAKGLEARVVILADTAAGRSNRGATEFTAGLTRVGSREFVTIAGPKFRNGAAIASTLDAAQHEDAEAVRLLYVALTRARDRLFVFSGGSYNRVWSDAISAWGEGVTHRTLDEPGPHGRAAAAPPAGAPDAVARFDAASAAVLALALPSFQSPSEAGANVDGSYAVPGAATPELARAVGRIVHARLAGLKTPDTGVPEAEVLSVLRSFDASPLAARLATITVLGREIPLLFADGESRWRGAIDLLYRDSGGDIVVVDHKTDAADDGAVARHAAQLAVYVRAIRRAMPEERVRAELWMLRTGSVLEVE